MRKEAGDRGHEDWAHTCSAKSHRCSILPQATSSFWSKTFNWAAGELRASGGSSCLPMTL